MALRKDAGADLGDALRQASRINDVDKIKQLLAKGADPNSLYVSCTRLARCIIPEPLACT